MTGRGADPVTTPPRAVPVRPRRMHRRCPLSPRALAQRSIEGGRRKIQYDFGLLV